APKEKIREDALRIFASNRSLNEVTAPVAESVGNKVRYGHKRPPLEYEKPHALSYGPKETLAYLAAVMPSSYATLHRVLSEIKLRDSKFKPSRILDFGTGPGTSLWAVDEVWGLEGLEAFHGVDLSESMLDVANEFIRTLFTRKENPNCQLRLDQHFSYMPGEDSYDLVIASNVFSEYPNDTLRQKALEALWERCGNTLALVERGTPRGFHIVNQARELLKMCESHIMGPCAQDMGCPLAKASKFCHFQQQLQRPRFLMEVKDSKSNQEFANYSYLILRKGPRPALPMSFADDASYQLGTFHWGRIVDKPNKRGGHIKIKLCSPNGVLLEDVTFTKAQGGSIYRDARKATWGDLFPHRGKAPSLTNLPSQFKKDSA
ncbi:37S ribosomal protein S22, partial [Massospora cicadina]